MQLGQGWHRCRLTQAFRAPLVASRVFQGFSRPWLAGLHRGLAGSPAQAWVPACRNSVPHVLLRVGNIRGNFLMNPEIRLSYMQRLVTSEGEVGFKVNPQWHE